MVPNNGKKALYIVAGTVLIVFPLAYLAMEWLFERLRSPTKPTRISSEKKITTNQGACRSPMSYLFAFAIFAFSLYPRSRWPRAIGGSGRAFRGDRAKLLARQRKDQRLLAKTIAFLPVARLWFVLKILKDLAIELAELGPVVGLRSDRA